MQSFIEKKYDASLALIGTCVLWASAFVFIRKTIQVYSPVDVALLRYGIASVVMFGLYFLRTRHNTVRLSDLPKLALMGIIGIAIYNIALNNGELRVPSATACFIISQIPVFSTVFAYTFLKESLTRMAIVGLVVSFCGVLIIAIDGFTELGSGLDVLYVIIAALCGSTFSVMQKPLLKRVDPFQLVAWSIWSGTLVMMFWAPSTVHQLLTAPLNVTLDIVFIGVFPAAIAYALWSYGIARLPVNHAVRYLYAMPLIALLLGWIMLGELPNRMSIAGGIIAIMGAVVAGL